MSVYFQDKMQYRRLMRILYWRRRKPWGEQEEDLFKV